MALYSDWQSNGCYVAAVRRSDVDDAEVGRPDNVDAEHESTVSKRRALLNRKTAGRGMYSVHCVGVIRLRQLSVCLSVCLVTMV